LGELTLNSASDFLVEVVDIHLPAARDQKAGVCRRDLTANMLNSVAHDEKVGTVTIYVTVTASSFGRRSLQAHSEGRPQWCNSTLQYLHQDSYFDSAVL
jgi:hypothetical protein